MSKITLKIKNKYLKNKKNYKKNKKSYKKNKRSYKIFKKGGNNDENNICCMCENKINLKNSLTPRECLNENGRKAHRICSECWWNPETGFAREGINHQCPGCKKKMPFTNVPIIKKSSIPAKIIDLTEDD
jgi:hypothetical protein